MFGAIQVLYTYCLLRLCSDKWGENSYKCSSLLQNTSLSHKLRLSTQFSLRKPSPGISIIYHYETLSSKSILPQVPGVWGPCKLKLPDKPTGGRRERLDNKKSERCGLCANNEEICPAITRQELVLCEISRSLSEGHPTKLCDCEYCESHTPMCNNNNTIPVLRACVISQAVTRYLTSTYPVEPQAIPR